jgi:hypothetical protein
MAKCVTCGRRLHPERAKKYNYCTDRKCQEKNSRGLTILALGVNKAADHYQILDERTEEKVATGRYAEEMASGRQPERRSTVLEKREGRRRARPAPASRKTTRSENSRRPWNDSQQELALIYNSRGIRPDEIAERLGLSTYTVTQMILEGKKRAKP